MRKNPFSVPLGIAALLFPLERALAAASSTVTDTMNDVAGSMNVGLSGGDFSSIFGNLGTMMFYFVNVAAILTIVVAGLLAVVAQDEGRITKSRKTVVMALMGIVLMNVAYAVQQGYIAAFDYDHGSNPYVGAGIIAREVVGFMGFIEVPVAIFAVLTIIIYGIKAMVDYGGENGVTSFRKALFAVLLGIAIMAVQFSIAGAVIPFDPTGIVSSTGAAGIVVPAVLAARSIMFFAAIVAVVVIIIAGIIMVVSIGKEEQYTKAKGILVRTLMGLFIMIISLALLLLIIIGVS